MKKHITKQEAVRNLKTRVSAAVPDESIIEGVNPADVGEDFTTFLGRMERSLADVRMLKANGGDVMEVGLRALSNQDLGTVMEILQSKEGRRFASEEKLQKVLPLVFRNLQTLESARYLLVQKQTMVMRDLMTIFIDEFNIYNDNGSAQVDMKKFKEKVADEMSRRRFVMVPEGGEQPACTVS